MAISKFSLLIAAAARITAPARSLALKETALIIVDFQNDYYESYPGAKYVLEETEEKSARAAKLLAKFRELGMPVIHVRHEFPTEDAPFFLPNSDGAKIHESVAPIDGEKVILKHYINSFRETDLKETLDDLGAKNLMIVGAMSHMCIDTLTRAGEDAGYNMTVIHDSCATLAQEFNGTKVSAKNVHAAYMAALKFAFAKVIDHEEALKTLE